MHELSVAEAVVEIADRHAAGRKVSRVDLQVGHLRQVVPSALAFAFELLSTGTCLEGAELVIDEVPARGRCRSCQTEATMARFPLQCPRCGGIDMDITAGEELLVSAIECEEAMATEGTSYGV